MLKEFLGWSSVTLLGNCQIDFGSAFGTWNFDLKLFVF